MPIQSCSSDGNPGYKWGDSGKCYTYTPGDESSQKEARKKATAQGIAIGDIEIERANEVTTSSMGSGIKHPQQGYRRKKVKKDYNDSDHDFLNEFLLKEEVEAYEEFLDIMSLEENIEAISLSILEKEVDPDHLNMPDEEGETPEEEDQEYPDLNARQRAQYEGYEAIVEEYGVFDQSTGADGAHYASADKNPFKEEGMICANCVFYQGGGGCEIVSGDIEPNAICKLWIIPEKLMVKPSDSVEKVTYGRPGPNDPRKTPAKPSERRRGSRKNPKGSAESGSSVSFSEAVTSSLKTKMENHNKKVDSASKKATLSALKAVYRRGAGAFSTSHRPGMTRGQWAMARVNAYLYLLRNGRPSNPNYNTDNDLLPKGHPKSSK